MSNIALSVVCFILECIILLFVVLSLGLDLLRGKSPMGLLVGTTYHRACFSFWGIKRCGPHKTNPGKALNKGFPTKKILRTVNCAAAFDVISLAVVLVAVILSALVMCKCLSGIGCVILYVMAAITLIVSLGCLLGVYYMEAAHNPLTGAVVKVKDAYHIGDGAGLLLTAWCLQVVNMVLMIVNACCC